MIKQARRNASPHVPAVNRSASWKTRHKHVSLKCPNLTTLKDYDVQVMIGQGAYGVVQRAVTKKSRQSVAIKQYDKGKLAQDDSRVNALQKEISILQHLDHVGIMKFYDAIDSGNKVSIIVEYVNGSNLFQYIRKMHGQRIVDEEQTKFLFRQVVESVSFMHSQNVVHRDLKLENVLLDRTTHQTKLIDFGFSTRVKSVNEQKLPFNCGTPIYMCPDLAQKKEHLGGPSDIWALGVMLFILLTGKLPFYGAFEEDLFRRIINGKYKWPSLIDKQGNPVEPSNGAKNLVRRILMPDPLRRPTAQQILKDPWLAAKKN